MASFPRSPPKPQSDVVSENDNPHREMYVKSVHHPIKAKRNRKRHVPAGPAGVWFQAQQQSRQKKAKNIATLAETRQEQRPDDFDDEEEEDQSNMAIALLAANARADNNGNGSALAMCYSMAWVQMQNELHLTTPRISNCSLQERYNTIRPHIPQEFMLLAELVLQPATRNTWKMPPTKALVVLVHRIQTIGSDALLWTVELTDETGVMMTAWMDPDTVQREMQQLGNSTSSTASSSNTNTTNTDHATQQQARQPVLQTGAVWMLRGATFMLVPSECNHHELSTATMDEDLETHEVDCTQLDGRNGAILKQMLLISRRNIERVWTPSQADHAVSDDEYIKWMERRNAVSTSQKSNETMETTNRGCSELVARQLEQVEEPLTLKVLNGSRNNDDQQRYRTMTNAQSLLQSNTTDSQHVLHTGNPLFGESKNKDVSLPTCSRSDGVSDGLTFRRTSTTKVQSHRLDIPVAIHLNESQGRCFQTSREYQTSTTETLTSHAVCKPVPNMEAARQCLPTFDDDVSKYDAKTEESRQCSSHVHQFASPLSTHNAASIVVIESPKQFTMVTTVGTMEKMDSFENQESKQSGDDCAAKNAPRREATPPSIDANNTKCNNLAAGVAAPKSKLWSGAADLLNLLDEEDIEENGNMCEEDEKTCVRQPVSSLATNQSRENNHFDKAPLVANSPKRQSRSIFQPSCFAGMDLEALLDEENDDD